MATPIIALIAALDRNRVIGHQQRLPWHLPADLRRFRHLTMSKPMIMGRRTWESLPGLLPGRPHIVMSKNPNYSAPGCTLVTSFEDALIAAGDALEVCVIGGAQLFAEFLPHAHRLYLTHIQAQFPGDTYFPAWNPEFWIETARQEIAANPQTPFAYHFVTLERRIQPESIAIMGA